MCAATSSSRDSNRRRKLAHCSSLQTTAPYHPTRCAGKPGFCSIREDFEGLVNLPPPSPEAGALSNLIRACLSIPWRLELQQAQRGWKPVFEAGKMRDLKEGEEVLLDRTACSIQHAHPHVKRLQKTWAMAERLISHSLDRIKQHGMTYRSRTLL